MQEPRPQDSDTDLLAPAPDVFADLLARTLSELPSTLSELPSTKEVIAPSDGEGDPPRRGLIHRIIGRRLRRAAERESPPPDEVVEAVPPPSAPEPEPVDDEEDDVLILDEVVEAVPPPSAPEPEPVDDDDDDDDVLILDDGDAVPPSQEPESRVAIPAALTPEATPFPGDSPNLLERMFGRHKPQRPEIMSAPVVAPPPPEDAESITAEDEDDGDILVLDDSVLAPEPEPVTPPGVPTDFLLQQVLDALAAQSTVTAPCAPAKGEEGGGQHELLRQVLLGLSNPAATLPDLVPEPVEEARQDGFEAEAEAEAEGDDDDDDDNDNDNDILILDDSLMVEAAAAPSPVGMSAEEMTALIAAATPEGMGNLDLPERLDALAALLLTPADDFAAQDLLHECWPRGSFNVTSRALLAVAVNLSRNFGLPGKLPMAASKAWRMLEPQTFQAALAQRLEAISDFIFAWQRAQYSFLSLEFGEVELIEYLFENLHPVHNCELLASVMHFKVLSGRRIGLLRRIPVHARRVVEGLGPRRQGQALVHLEQVRALLVQLERPDGFPPIVEAASRSLADVDKLIKQVSAPPAPPPDDSPRGGLTLGRM